MAGTSCVLSDQQHTTISRLSRSVQLLSATDSENFWGRQVVCLNVSAASVTEASVHEPTPRLSNVSLGISRDQSVMTPPWSGSTFNDQFNTTSPVVPQVYHSAAEMRELHPEVSHLQMQPEEMRAVSDGDGDADTLVYDLKFREEQFVSQILALELEIDRLSVVVEAQQEQLETFVQDRVNVLELERKSASFDAERNDHRAHIAQLA